MTGSSIETEDLPADEGAEAYRQRKLPEHNPYGADDWRHGEWKFGWMNEEECDGTSPFDWQSGVFKQQKSKVPF